MQCQHSGSTVTQGTHEQGMAGAIPGGTEQGPGPGSTQSLSRVCPWGTPAAGRVRDPVPALMAAVPGSGRAPGGRSQLPAAALPPPGGTADPGPGVLGGQQRRQQPAHNRSDRLGSAHRGAPQYRVPRRCRPEPGEGANDDGGPPGGGGNREEEGGRAGARALTFMMLARGAAGAGLRSAESSRLLLPEPEPGLPPPPPRGPLGSGAAGRGEPGGGALRGPSAIPAAPQQRPPRGPGRPGACARRRCWLSGGAGGRRRGREEGTGRGRGRGRRAPPPPRAAAARGDGAAAQRYRHL